MKPIRTAIAGLAEAFTIVSAIVLGIALLAMLLGDYSWYLENVRHFPVQWILLAMVGATISAMRRRWKQVVMLGMLGIFHAIPLIPDLVARPLPVSDGTPLRVMVANVRTENRQYSQLLSLIAAENPDLLVTIEVDPPWVEELATANFPYEFDAPGRPHFGIAVFSKRPFADTEAFQLDRAPAIRVRLSEPPVSFVAVHTYRQASADIAALQTEQFEKLVKMVPELGVRAVILGDLNATPWCGAFHRLLAGTGFRDSRLGFGIQGSWPTWLPAPLRIPIDHLLLSEGVEIRSRSITAEFGSDHLAVIADLVVR